MMGLAGAALLAFGLSAASPALADTDAGTATVRVPAVMWHGDPPPPGMVWDVTLNGDKGGELAKQHTSGGRPDPAFTFNNVPAGQIYTASIRYNNTNENLHCHGQTSAMERQPAQPSSAGQTIDLSPVVMIFDDASGRCHASP